MTRKLTATALHNAKPHVWSRRRHWAVSFSVSSSPLESRTNRPTRARRVVVEQRHQFAEPPEERGGPPLELLERQGLAGDQVAAQRSLQGAKIVLRHGGRTQDRILGAAGLIEGMLADGENDKGNRENQNDSDRQGGGADVSRGQAVHFR